MKITVCNRWILWTFIVCLSVAVSAGNWPQFRGPGGSGISKDKNIPSQWSETENLVWKMELPGPGSSSPIVWEDNIFLTCYSGYGLKEGEGDGQNLKQHVLCINRNNGELKWEKTIPAAGAATDPYRGFITQHGYATATPVTDGERVFVFFGKSGIFAFNFEGKQLWRTPVGEESSERKWGSSTSPILYKDLLIANAAEESKAVYALDKNTGKEAWKVSSEKLLYTYGSPAVANLPDGKAEIVIVLPTEAWGLDPETGERNWTATLPNENNIAPTPIVQDGIIYGAGGFRDQWTVAIRAGGKGDVSETNLLWKTKDSSYVPSFVLADGHLYWADHNGEARCLEASSGKLIYKEPLLPNGRFLIYASPVLADGKLYVQTRKDGCFVLEAKPEYSVIAQNKFDSDDTEFNASPAICNSQILLRSNKALYCIQAK